MERKQNLLKEEIVGAIVEHLASFEERIIQTMDYRFTKVDEKFKKIDERFTKIDEKFAKQDERFTSIDDQFRKQGVILEDIQGKVQLIAEGQDAIHERIDRLDKRVTILETR